MYQNIHNFERWCIIFFFFFFLSEQLQNEANLDNDFIREYFQSQKALYRQQIEARRQYRGGQILKKKNFVADC